MLEPFQNFTILKSGTNARTLEEMDKPIAVEHNYEKVVKTISMSVKFLLSSTSPTSLTIEIAQKDGINLLGYNGRRIHYIYTHPEEVIA